VVLRHQIKKVARNFLLITGIPVNVNKLASYCNALLFYQTMPEKISGFSIKSPVEGRYCIVLNNRMPESHNRFTIVHEIWHILRKVDSISYNWQEEIPSAEERYANIFATELLMPKEAILELYYKERWRDIDLYCDFFQVSKKAMEIRLFDELNLPIEDFYPL